MEDKSYGGGAVRLGAAVRKLCVDKHSIKKRRVSMFRKFRTHGFLAVLIMSMLLSGCFGLFKKAEPEITVAGIKDGATYDEPVTPEITAKKDTTIKEITLNDEPFESGTEIIENGEYTLAIVAEHKKGTTKTFEYSFTVNITKPIIRVTGVENGGAYFEAVTPKATTLAPEDIITATLDDEEFTLDTPISEVGEYTLKVTATNADNESSEVTITFRILSPVHEFTINASGTGFTADKGSVAVNTDPDYVKTGERSLQFDNEVDKKSAFRIHRRTKYHPDWINDWSPYNRFSCWIYIVDKNKIDKLDYKLYTPSNPHDKGNTYSFDLSQLNNGWNRLDFAFADIMTNMDDLKNMADNDDIWMEFLVRSETEATTVYFDNIILYNSGHYNPSDE